MKSFSIPDTPMRFSVAKLRRGTDYGRLRYVAGNACYEGDAR